jgi:steroid delta-isomerase-like uncharacterized protein
MSGQQHADVLAAETTTDLAQRYLEAAWNRRDMDALDLLASPDLEVSFSLMREPPRNLESFKQVLRRLATGIPDLHFDIRHLATEGNTAVFSWQGSGTHTGGPLFGLDPSGRAVRWSGLSVVEVADGRVTREWGEEDGLGLLRQLGAVPG